MYRLATGSDGSRSKIFDPGPVNFLWLGSGQPFMVLVRIRKISPKNIKFFNFFSFGSKKIALGWVGLLFTAGQK